MSPQDKKAVKAAKEAGKLIKVWANSALLTELTAEGWQIHHLDGQLVYLEYR